MNTHTREPWEAYTSCQNECCWFIRRAGSDGDAWGNVTNPECTQSDARRIVACVNACAGCSTELLEDVPAGFFSSKYGTPHYVDKLEKQRDMLLAELKNIAYANTTDWEDPNDFKAWAQNRCRAVIEQIESKS